MNTVRSFTAGILDAGFASAATFAMGLYAVNSLPSVALAAYSVLFTGWVLSALLPQQISFTPSRLHVLKGEAREVPMLSGDLQRALPTLAAAFGITALSVLPVALTTDPWSFVGLALAAAALCPVSAFQDHLRACLHLAERHSLATAVSAVNLMTTLTCIGVAAFLVPALSQTRYDSNPFLPLLVGNVLSAIAAVAFLARIPRNRTYVQDPLSKRIQLLGSDAVLQGALYLASVLVVAMLGSTALAQLEAARVAAAPVLVAAIGMTAFLLPRGIRRVTQGDSTAVREGAGITAVIAAVGGLYAALLLLLDPVLDRVTGQNTVPGLGSARAASFALEAGAYPLSGFFYTWDRAPAWIGTSALSALVLLGTLLLTLPAVGPFGMAIAQAASACTRIAAGVLLLRRYQPLHTARVRA